MGISAFELPLGRLWWFLESEKCLKFIKRIHIPVEKMIPWSRTRSSRTRAETIATTKSGRWWLVYAGMGFVLYRYGIPVGHQELSGTASPKTSYELCFSEATTESSKMALELKMLVFAQIFIHLNSYQIAFLVHLGGSWGRMFSHSQFDSWSPYLYWILLNTLVGATKRVRVS